jgi:predicted HicB family RNase H-like nuclease
LTLRVPSEKHRELAIRSAEESVSINQFILSRL